MPKPGAHLSPPTQPVPKSHPRLPRPGARAPRRPLYRLPSSATLTAAPAPPPLPPPHIAGADLGCTPAEIEGMGDARFDHLVHPDDVPKVAAHIMRVLNANDKAVIETEYRMRRADGTYSIFATRDVVFARNALGEV